jgi:hypothetical protein
MDISTQQEIQQFLAQAGFAPPQQYGWLRPYGHPLGWRYPQPVTDEEVARDVLELAGQYGLKLGNWLRTTDGAIVLAAVQAVMPAAYAADINVLAAGLRLAARMQHEQGLQDVAGPFAAGVLVGAVITGAVLALNG